MNVKKKVLPVICLLSTYVHWVKPRLLPATAASNGGRSWLLRLCARSRFLIPMIVFTAFWIIDAQMQIGVAVNLMRNRNVRIILRQPELDVDNEDEDDGVGDDETYTIDSYSDNSFASDSSLFVLDDVESALHEYVESESAQGASFG